MARLTKGDLDTIDLGRRESIPSESGHRDRCLDAQR